MSLNTALCCISDNIPNYVTGTKLMFKHESIIKNLACYFQLFMVLRNVIIERYIRRPNKRGKQVRHENVSTSEYYCSI